MSLFGPQTGVVAELLLPEPAYQIGQRELLNWEKELIGLYVSDHPLNPYRKDLERAVTHNAAQLSEAGEKSFVRVAGLISSVRPHQTRNGKSMGFAVLEDLYGTIDLVIFPQTWDRFYHLFVQDNVVLIEGKLDPRGGEPNIIVNKVSTEFQVVNPAAPTSPQRKQRRSGKRLGRQQIQPNSPFLRRPSNHRQSNKLCPLSKLQCLRLLIPFQKIGTPIPHLLNQSAGNQHRPQTPYL